MTRPTPLYPDGLYLDDRAVGQRFRSTEHAVDDVQIIEFARAFDPQPIVIRGETFNQRDELVQVFISRLVVSRRPS